MDKAFKTVAFISLIFCSGVEFIGEHLFKQFFVSIIFVILKVTANAKMEMGSRRDN